MRHYYEKIKVQLNVVDPGCETSWLDLAPMGFLGDEQLYTIQPVSFGGRL